MADTRIHGTTRRQVGKVFEQVERSRLLPLPASLFPVFEEAPRTVHRDGYVNSNGRIIRCRPNTWAVRCGCAGKPG